MKRTVRIPLIAMLVLALVVPTLVSACGPVTQPLAPPPDTEPTPPPALEETQPEVAPTEEEEVPPPEEEPEPMPDIKAAATLPAQKVNFGQQFPVIIIINNYGDGVANNLHLYARANPAGFFAVLNCTHPYQPVVPAGIDISLGDTYPNDRTEVRLQLQAPTQGQVGKTAMNVEFQFTYDYYGGEETQAGTVVFALGAGGVMGIWEGE